MSIIRPEYLLFDDLLQKKLFEIPNYQRTYSWESKQRKDLFNDIEKIAAVKDADRHHFMSTIVCLSQPSSQSRMVGTNRYDKYYVVDGQQRITTLIILYKAISNFIKDKYKKLYAKNINQETLKELIEEANIIDNLLVKKDKRLVLLQSNHDNYSYFRNYLTSGDIPDKKGIKTFTDRNLIDAFNESQRFVESWGKDIAKLITILKNRLGFVFYVLNDAGSVYRVFEVVNSRGKAVDWLDKCKSMLMGIVYDEFPRSSRDSHIDELHCSWTEIYRIIGLLDVSGEEIIKVAATLLNQNSGNKPLSGEDSLAFLHEYCRKDKDNIFEVVDFLKKVTEQLEKIYKNKRLKAVTKILHARMLAVAINLSKFSKDEKGLLLDQWERVTFRIFGIFRKDSRTGIGDYVRLAKDIYSKSLDAKDVLTELKNIGKSYPISKFSEMLYEKNCYDGWEEEARYFFYRYEEYLAKLSKTNIKEDVWEDIWNNSPIRSIEHIYPQKPEKILEWKNKVGKSPKAHEKNVHRLGNLLVLPPNINSQCGNSGFSNKKKIYGEQFIRMAAEITRKRDWTDKSIDEREKALIAWAKNTWCNI